MGDAAASPWGSDVAPTKAAPKTTPPVTTTAANRRSGYHGDEPDNFHLTSIRICARRYGIFGTPAACPPKLRSCPFASRVRPAQVAPAACPGPPSVPGGKKHISSRMDSYRYVWNLKR